MRDERTSGPEQTRDVPQRARRIGLMQEHQSRVGEIGVVDRHLIHIGLHETDVRRRNERARFAQRGRAQIDADDGSFVLDGARHCRKRA